MIGLLNSLREYANLIPKPGIMDILDILVVAYLFYRIFMLIRQTPAARILRSILLIMLVYGLTRILQMHALNFVLNFVLELGAFALIIIFQPELRRGLEHIGARSFSEYFSGRDTSRQSEYVIEQLVLACGKLSQSHTGALIVLERTTPLDHYFTNGTIIDAKVSEELLSNIFFPKAALHDGALIIQGERAAAAACVLPLTENSRLSSDLGTRHRAGIGMSEATDAVVVIVSEETGIISVAVGGHLKRHLEPETLHKLLTQELGLQEETQPGLLARLKQHFSGEGKEHEE